MEDHKKGTIFHLKHLVKPLPDIWYHRMLRFGTRYSPIYLLGEAVKSTSRRLLEIKRSFSTSVNDLEFREKSTQIRKKSIRNCTIFL